jgi:uncharacterized cupin superfamily protein
MTTTTHTVAQGSVDAETYEPFHGFDVVLEGDPAAEVSWLRTTSAGNGVLYTGVFVVHPSGFRYTFAAVESFHGLEGAVDIELDSGERAHLHAGDIASFPKGARSTWTVTTSLKKFFVISG